jgi:hypothetical protein
VFGNIHPGTQKGENSVKYRRKSFILDSIANTRFAIYWKEPHYSYNDICCLSVDVYKYVCTCVCVQAVACRTEN